MSDAPKMVPTVMSAVRAQAQVPPDHGSVPWAASISVVGEPAIQPVDMIVVPVEPLSSPAPPIPVMTPNELAISNDLGFEIEDDGENSNARKSVSRLKFDIGSPQMVILMSKIPIKFVKHGNRSNTGTRFKDLDPDVWCPGKDCPICLMETPVLLMHYVAYSLDQEVVTTFTITIKANGKVGKKSFGATFLNAVRGAPEPSMLLIEKVNTFDFIIKVLPVPPDISIPEEAKEKAKKMIANPITTLAEMYTKYTSNDLWQDPDVRRQLALRGLLPAGR